MQISKMTARLKQYIGEAACMDALQIIPIISTLKFSIWYLAKKMYYKIPNILGFKIKYFPIYMYF